MFLLSETQRPTHQPSSEKGGFVVPSCQKLRGQPSSRIRFLYCQKLRGQPSSGKGVFVIPSVRNSGANTVLGKEESLFFLLETQRPAHFWERRIRCSFGQKLRCQPSSGKGGFRSSFCQKLMGQPSSASSGNGGFVVPSVKNSGTNPILGKRDSLFLLLETQRPAQFWERRIRCLRQKLRGQPSSGKGGFVAPSVRNSGANLIKKKSVGRGCLLLLRQP